MMRSTPIFAAIFAAISLPIWVSLVTGTESPRLIDQAILREALESSTPHRLPGTDQLEFFGRRLAERGVDRVAARGLGDAYLARFQAYGRDDDLAQAESSVDLLLSRRPSDPDLWSRRAQIHLARHEFKQAEVAARRAVSAAAPEDAGLYRLRLFDALFALGQHEAAARLLDLPADQNAFARMVRKARLLDRLGHVVEARDLMRESLTLAEAYAQPVTVLAWNHVELGHFEFHSGNPEAAVTHYREALRIAPGYPAALEGLGWLAYGVDEDAGAARSLFTRALENGGHQDLRLALAEVALFADEPARAQAEISHLQALAAGDEAARRLLAEPLALALSEIRPDVALTLSEENVAERRTAESLAVHGWVLHNLGDHEQARDLFDEALAWGAPPPMVFYLAGRQAAEAGKLDEARRWLRTAREGEAELGPRRARQVADMLKRL